MTEIAQLFESALQNNRASLLRKAAMNTVARMPPQTTLRELIESDAGTAIRGLTLRELKQALANAGLGELPEGVEHPATFQADSGSSGSPNAGANGSEVRRRRIHVTSEPSENWTESREERLYKRILDAMDEPLTIGQLAKRVELDVDELRGYINWMKKMGKVESSGRARATRYQAVR